MAKLKDSSYLTTGSTKVTVRLKDLDKDLLFKKVREIEEYDKVHYRKTCGAHQQQSFQEPKSQTNESDFFDLCGTSSEESVEYQKLEPYTTGALGLIRLREHKRKSPRPVSTKKHADNSSPKRNSFDWLSAVILSELGLLSKFERKGKKEYVKSDSKVKEKRRYYVS